MVAFRPSKRSQAARIVQIILASGLLLLLLGYTFLRDSASFGGLFICGFWLVFWDISVAISLRRLRKIKVLMDEQSFQAHIGNESYHFAWQDILLARFLGNLLELATESERNVLSLEHLNPTQIEQNMRKFAPESAFHKDAYLNVPAYQNAIADYQTLLQNETVHFQVGYSRSSKSGYWFLFFVTSSSFALLFFDENIRLFITICLVPFLIIFGGLAFRSIQTLEVTTEKVIVNNGFRKSEFRWHEIQKIKAGLLYEQFIFYGNGRRLVAPGPKIWGEANGELYELICAQIWQHQIKVEDQNHRRPFFLLNTVPTASIQVTE